MLVAAMNTAEITAEILRDIKKIEESTYLRLMQEYSRERKKFNIDKSSVYPKHYMVKTASKNTWILFLHKNPLCSKYKNEYDTVGSAVMYCYTSKGWRAFRCNLRLNYIEVFNAHLFSRFNERMNLNLNNPVDIIKKFFTDNEYLEKQMIQRKGRNCFIAICKAGMTFGEKYAGEMPWLVHKTFINNELKKPSQVAAEKFMIQNIENKLFKTTVGIDQNYGSAFIMISKIISQIKSTGKDFN